MIALLILLTFGVNDSHAYSRRAQLPTPIPMPVASDSPIASPTPLPSTESGNVIFQPVENYSTDAQRLKVKSAALVLNRTIQSKCFADFMSKRAMIQTGGRTAAGVVSHLQSITGVVPVKFYYRCMRSWKCPTGTTAVAYRNVGDQTINLNSAVYGSWSSDCDVASVQAHESVGHSLGNYDHSFDWNAQRDFSVPYSINKAFTECCK